MIFQEEDGKIVDDSGNEYVKRKSILKNKPFILITTSLLIVIALLIAMDFAYSNEITAQSLEIQELNRKNDKLQKRLRETKESLSEANKKIDKAKPWFEMEEIEQERLKKQIEEEKAKKEEEIRLAKEKEEAERKAKEEADRIAKEKEEKQGYETGITYDQLSRTPDTFLGKKVKFKGKVLQVMEGDLFVGIRLAVDSNYKNVMYVEIPEKLLENNRILEDDVITVYGISMGLYTYKATLGQQITIPSMLVDKFDR